MLPLGDYLDALPDRAFLVVEVADSTVPDDRRKAALYAAAGVPVYWLVNLVAEVIEVHAGPEIPRGSAAALTSFERGAVLRQVRMRFQLPTTCSSRSRASCRRGGDPPLESGVALGRPTS